MIGRQNYWYPIFVVIIVIIGVLNVHNMLQKTGVPPCNPVEASHHSGEELKLQEFGFGKYESNSSGLKPPPPLYRLEEDELAIKKEPSMEVAAVNLTLVTDDRDTVERWDWPETAALMPKCREKFQNLTELPDVSVIISYHNNEDLSNVLRTVHSIFERSPPQLLKEVILIDDCSIKEDLRVVLPLYVKSVFGSKIRHFRSSTPLGLIKARLKGIRLAQGEVVIVMDSHLEVQPLWLEPLLYEIKVNKSTLAASYLDYMENKGLFWEYVHSAASWVTYFDWSFVFGFQSMNQKEVARRRDPTQPVKCSVTVGTIWAMDRKFFFEVGALDEGMEKWGGENLDLAVRVWLFNGRVVNVPCSRVAHTESAHNRDYRRGWEGDIHRNYKRFAEVWLDQYIKYFYRNFPRMQREEVGDLKERFEVKARCPHNFQWYLKNVFPELGLPDEDSYAWGGLKNLGLMMCLQAMAMMAPAMYGCGGFGNEQDLYWSKSGNLRLPMHVIQAETNRRTNEDGFLTTEWTYYHGTNQSSQYLHVKDGPIIEMASGKCVEPLKVIIRGRSSYQLSLHLCDILNPYQRWRFQHYSEAYRDFLQNLSNEGTLSKMDSDVQTIVTKHNLTTWSNFVPTAQPRGRIIGEEN